MAKKTVATRRPSTKLPKRQPPAETVAPPALAPMTVPITTRDAGALLGCSAKSAIGLADTALEQLEFVAELAAESNSQETMHHALLRLAQMAGSARAMVTYFEIAQRREVAS